MTNSATNGQCVTGNHEYQAGTREMRFKIRELRESAPACPCAFFRCETNEYDGNGNKTLGKDGEGKQTTFVYEAANRLIERPKTLVDIRDIAGVRLILLFHSDVTCEDGEANDGDGLA